MTAIVKQEIVACIAMAVVAHQPSNPEVDVRHHDNVGAMGVHLARVVVVAPVDANK
jgi:hypothetical protein